MKDELGRKLMTKFVALKSKTYGYLTNDTDENKRAKRTKQCFIKRKLNLKILNIVQKQLNLKI